MVIINDGVSLTCKLTLHGPSRLRRSIKELSTGGLEQHASVLGRIPISWLPLFGWSMQSTRKSLAPHHKVRTGCSQCKHRRIKCDELRPRCRKCSKANRACSYAQPSNETEIRSLVVGQCLVQRFSSSDLELLHHWTAVTSVPIGATDSHQLAMREFHKMALASPYLM